MSDDAAELYKAKHPLALCTDDVGVFSTSLSGEYKIAASAFGTSDFTVAYYTNIIRKLTNIVSSFPLRSWKEGTVSASKQCSWICICRWFSEEGFKRDL